jgi:hypothetical protein
MKIVVEDQKTGNFEKYIVEKEWFVELKLKDTFNEYGQCNVEKDEEANIVHAHNFFNGSNFQTVFLEDDICFAGDVKRIEDHQEEKKILEEFEKAIEIERNVLGYKKESKNYIFRMSDSVQKFWPLAIVEEKEL